VRIGISGTGFTISLLLSHNDGGGVQETFTVDWCHPSLAFELLNGVIDYNRAQATLIHGTPDAKEVLLAKLNEAWMALPAYMCSATVSSAGGLILRCNDTKPRLAEPPAAAGTDSKEGVGQVRAKGMAQAAARSVRAAVGAVLPGTWNNVDSTEV
jgi:hypothetical protein